MRLNSNEIARLIPHRYPFALVDRIDEVDETARTIRGRKCISVSDMTFCGHFPEHHVYPGVLLVEALAQCGCVLLMLEEKNRGKIPLFAGINRMRFRRQVVPGDVVELEAAFTKEKAGLVFAKVRASVEGQTVCEGEILCALGEEHA